MTDEVAPLPVDLSIVSFPNLRRSVGDAPSDKIPSAKDIANQEGLRSDDSVDDGGDQDDDHADDQGDDKGEDRADDQGESGDHQKNSRVKELSRENRKHRLKNKQLEKELREKEERLSALEKKIAKFAGDDEDDKSSSGSAEEDRLKRERESLNEERQSLQLERTLRRRTDIQSGAEEDVAAAIRKKVDYDDESGDFDQDSIDDAVEMLRKRKPYLFAEAKSEEKPPKEKQKAMGQPAGSGNPPTGVSKEAIAHAEKLGLSSDQAKMDAAKRYDKRKAEAAKK